MNKREISNRSPTEGNANVWTEIEDSPELPKKRKSNDGDGHDKLRPKRPLTGYNRFFKEERIRWKEEQSSSGMPEEKKQTFLTMGREISARWVRLPREQKKKYIAEYDKEMLQYRIDVEKYNREKEEKAAADAVAKKEQSAQKLKKNGAQLKAPTDSLVPGPSSLGSFDTNALLQPQMMENNSIAHALSNSGSSATQFALNQLHQQRQFEILLRQRLLDRQMQLESSLLSLRSLAGGSAVRTQENPSHILSATQMDSLIFPGANAAAPYSGLLSSTGNVQTQLQNHPRGGLIRTNFPYATLPEPSSSVAVGNVSNRSYEQLLLSLMLQQRNHRPSNNS
ncbi:hypothetical protein FisN_12Lu098 [Fistulifera solaris]|jgi:hypothetical protein|uniref:HMG box domain-containing protein n=1 Tax=Fistulifera solaris TaxID=1519565 RepID=A0A1Z5KH16_FISSO|nr:hypothetical protein FisN_12Lu098 [Fistulifera solaris]|eukprot:GAX25507.1 hypothetical protein FisN_12Lu098 [Fistulifera solaris]